MFFFTNTGTVKFLRTVPNDNLLTVIGSVSVLVPHPLIIRVTFMIKDNVLNRCMWATQRASVSGQAVAPVSFAAVASEFQVAQPGLVNPPTLLAALDLPAGTRLEARVTNPLLANPIDVEVIFEVQVSSAGTT